MFYRFKRTINSFDQRYFDNAQIVTLDAQNFGPCMSKFTKAKRSTALSYNFPPTIEKY